MTTIRYFTDADGYYLGSFWDDTPPPEGAIECEEKGFGFRKVSDEWVTYTEAEWTAHFAPKPTLEEWRVTASADAWQIAFVLGEVRWAALQTWANSHFNTRILVAKATVIPRTSDTVLIMAWVLGMKDDEIDEVFRTAATIRA